MNTLTHLAVSNNRKNRIRSILIIVSVFLSTLLLTVITVWGYGIIKSNRANADKLYGSYYGSYKGVTEDQLGEMKLRNEFTELGKTAKVGLVENTADLYLYFADATALTLNNKPEQLMKGSFPIKENEIAAENAFFEKLGYYNAKVGDTISLSSRVNLGSPYTVKTFVISGLLKKNEINSLSNSFMGFVSESYYNQLITKTESNYTVYFRLNPSIAVNYDTAKEQFQELAGKCGIDEEAVSVNTYYIMWAFDPGTETIVVCSVLAIIVILFSVVIIYNIYQVGIVHKVQDYGKLKALGATKRQLKKVVFREGMFLAVIGIPTGLIVGYLFSNITFRWLMKESQSIREINNIEQVSLFSVPILMLVAILSFLTVWTALKRPMRIVASISAVEAMRYQENGGKSKGMRKGRLSVGIVEMTLANLASNRKRTFTTISTMGLSCVLFVVIANFVGNIDEEYEARRQLEYGQFCISLDYSLNDTAYPENNLNNILKANPLTSQLVNEIKSLDRVTQVRTRKLMAIKEEADGKDKEESIMSVSVLNRNDFDKLKSYGSNKGVIDYDKATKEDAILFGWSHFLEEYGYSLDQTVNMQIDGQQIRSKAPLQGSFSSLDTDWAITEDTFNKLQVKGDLIGYIWVDCEKKDIGFVRNELDNILSDYNHLEITEYQDVLKAQQKGVGFMKVGIYAFLAIIGLIGFMNMANTMITSIVTRRQEFGVLQAIGMTNKQLNRMLQLDGLIFTVGTILVAFSVGTPGGYLLFLYGKKNSITGMNIYHFPLPEILAMVVVIALLQIVLSNVLGRNIKKASVIERIRYQE